jgi:glutamyl-tRNA reductase
VLVDIALPRGIDPSVRKIPGIFLYDIDDLERIVQPNPAEYEQAAAEAQKIVTTEAQGFRQKLLAERVVPTIIALRHRLDEICRQELDSFKNECGPFSQDQGEVLDAVTSRLTQRIAGSLARELKELPERAEQEQLTTAVQRLFHLESPQRALAGTRL